MSLGLDEGSSTGDLRSATTPPSRACSATGSPATMPVQENSAALAVLGDDRPSGSSTTPAWPTGPPRAWASRNLRTLAATGLLPDEQAQQTQQPQHSSSSR